MLKAILPAVTTCVLFAQAAPAATVEVSVDTNNTIPNVVANSIIADGEGADWTGGVLDVELNAGSVYNGAPDSNGPQSAFWNVSGFEILQWDTWFGVPGDGSNGFRHCPGSECGFVNILSGSMISIGWFNTRTTDTGTNRVGNVSLTDDAAGTWTLITSFSGGVLLHSSGVVINGAMVPEPGTLALLAVGGLALMKRAYKEQLTC